MNGDLVHSTGTIVVDLRKGFDSVPHIHLLSKLTKYGIKEKELQWFTSLITARQQFVCFNGVKSSFQNSSKCHESRSVYPQRPKAEVNNALRDLLNSSYPTKAEFVNCFIIHSKEVLV